MFVLKWGPIIHLPGGFAWRINVCLYFTALRTTLILTKSPTPFAEMQPQMCKEPLSCLSVACRQSLLYCSPALQQTNYFLLQPNISDFNSSVQSTCCHFSAPMFVSVVESLGLPSCQRHDFLAATFPWRPLLTRLQCFSFMCFSSNLKFPLHIPFLVLPVSLCFSKRASTVHLGLRLAHLTLDLVKS